MAHPTPRRHLLTAAALAVGTALALSACSGSTGSSSTGSGSTGSSSTGSAQPSDDALTVVAAIYPLQYVAEQIAGDRAAVSLLTPPGVEPHDMELTAAQVAQIGDADLVLYVPGFQPAVDEAIAQQAPDSAVDVTAGLTMLAGHDEADHAGEEHADEEHADEGGDITDPHVWLDPANMAAIGQTVATRLTGLDAAGSDAFAANEGAFTTAMQSLRTDLATGLATCRIRTMVVSHEAFGYLAAAADLAQVGISGLSPEAEPSPARLREVADIVTRDGVTTIYYETLVDPAVAQTLADEVGVATAVLDPLEGAPAGEGQDYLTAMQQNLQTLREGQDCP